MTTLYLILNYSMKYYSERNLALRKARGILL